MHVCTGMLAFSLSLCNRTYLFLREDHGVLGLELPRVASLGLVNVGGMVAASRHGVHRDLILVTHNLEELLTVVDVGGQHDAGADHGNGLTGRGSHCCC